MRTHLAGIAAFLLLLVAALVTFLPTSPNGATCGTWLSPEWSKAKTSSIVNEASASQAQAENAGLYELADEAGAVSTAAAHAYSVCSGALSARRTMALVLLVLGVAVPATVLVTPGRRAMPART